jgi:hypothetical protein
MGLAEVMAKLFSFVDEQPATAVLVNVATS